MLPLSLFAYKDSSSVRRTVRDIVPDRGYRRLEGRNAPAKRTKPEVTKKPNLAVRIQPACPIWSFAGSDAHCVGCILNLRLANVYYSVRLE